MPEDDLTRIREKLAALDEFSKMLAQQIGTLKDQYTLIQDLTIKLTCINSELTHVKECLASVDQRLGAIEEKPAQRWENIIQQIITGVIAALLGAALAFLRQ